jgi:hypothetical protein
LGCLTMDGDEKLAQGEWIPFADDKWNEIVPNLWMGGMLYGPTAEPFFPDENDFDVCVSMAGRGHPKLQLPNVKFFYPYLIADGELHRAEKMLVADALVQVMRHLELGHKVLVRCQAGYNRSGLVVALALMDLGHSADEAIALIRKKRSLHALCNPRFVDYIKSGL